MRRIAGNSIACGIVPGGSSDVTGAASSAGQSADAIVAAAERVGIAAISAPDLKAAVARARQDAEVDDLVVVTGSFRLVDPARAAVRRREH